MPKHSFSSKSHAYAWQEWAGRLLFIALFAGALLMVTAGHSQESPLSQARQQVTGAASPLGAVLGAPVEKLRQWVDDFAQALRHAGAASQLAKENAALQQWKQRAEQLEAENKALRRLLKEVPSMQMADLTARVLGSISGPYSHQKMLAAGSASGVQEQMAVVNEQGLVGRVVSVQQNTAQVLAVTDINFRVAVITGKSREHAVVKGLGEAQAGLFYLPKDSALQVGERLYTSGDGGLMPPGILVGTVSAIQGQNVRVIPAVDPSRLDYARLLMPKE